MKEYQKNIIAIIIIVIVGILVFRDMFTNEGFLIKSDNPVHMIEAKYIADNTLKEHHWINGWANFEYAGMPIQMYSYQIGIWLIILLYYLGINIFLAYKIALFIAAISVVITLYLVLKTRFSYFIALTTALFFIFQRDHVKLFLGGMWSHAIGLSILIIMIYIFSKNFNNLDIKKISILGLLFGLIILAHPFVMIAAAALIGCSLLLHIIRKKNFIENLWKHTLIGIIGILTSWFYLYPYYDTYGWYRTEYGWGLGASITEILYKLVGIFFTLKPNTEFLAPLMQGNYIRAISIFGESIYSNLPMLIADALFILGIYYYFKNKDENKTLLDLTFLFIIVSLILGTGFWFLFDFGHQIPFLGAALTYRFVYTAKIGLLIFSAYGMKKFIENKKIDNILIIKKKTLAIFTITVIILGLIVGVYGIPKEYSETSGTTPIFGETLEMYNWVKNNITDDSRIFIQNTYGNVKEPLITYDSIMPVMANHYTGKNFIGSFYATVFPLENKFNTEDNKIFGIKINEIKDEELIKNLQTYNIKHLIAIDPNLKKRLESSKNFKLIYESKNYKIYELLNYNPEYITSENNIEYEIIKFEDQEINLNIKNEYENNKITIKTAEHPYWKAYINDKDIDITKDENELMQIKIPKGEYLLNIEYKPVKLINILISVITILFVITIVNYKKKANLTRI